MKKRSHAWKIEIEKVPCRDEYERLGRAFQLLRSPPLVWSLPNAREENLPVQVESGAALKKAVGT